MKNVIKAGNKITKAVTTLFAVLFLIYGLLMLWDMYRMEINAFASYDLLKFRPGDEEELPFLEDLVEINPDTRAWITIYNTNIDYPIMQGKDDMEYLNKNVYGKYSLTGSIYESCQNSKDFSDPYTLIYGHHMENGSMFGDIDKFKNRQFFKNNSTGILILPEKVYDLKIMAFIETTAYDSDIYLNYTGECLSRAMYKRNIDAKKVIALSTCADATSLNRLVLLCSATIRTDPIPLTETSEGTQRKPIGHPMSGAYWAVMNLIIMLITIYAALMLTLKYKENRIINILLGIISVVLFVLTEDPHKPMRVCDIWTVGMIIILALIVGVSLYTAQELKIPLLKRFLHPKGKECD